MQVTDIAREDDGAKQEAVLTITASAEEVDAAAKEFFKQISQRDIPGFRKGKAPREILEQSVGGHSNAMGGVAETLINEQAFSAIDASDVVFLEEPTFNVDEEVVEGKPFSFTVSGPVAPKMSLTDDGPVEIQMPPEKATDEEVEQALRDLQDYYHTFEEVEDPDYKLQDGDYAMISMNVTNHDKPVPGLRNAKRLIGIGTGTMPESFDKQLIGAKIGDDLEFDFDAKAEDGSSEFGDGELHAIVHIDGIRNCILPPLDDELAHKVGCTNAEDMRKQMRHTLDEQHAKDRPRMMADRAVAALVERLDGDVPDYFIDFMSQDVGREYMQRLQEQGTNLQEMILKNNIHADEVKDTVRTEAVRRAAIDCALEALFAAKGWEVTEGDVEELFADEDNPAEVRAKWEDANRMADVHKMARRSKATRWLVENAVITEENK